MLDLASTATAAALLNNALSAVDKVYNWWMASRNKPLASKVLRNDPQDQAFKAVSTKNDKAERIVITYEQLSKQLDQRDFDLIKSFEARMNFAMVQWEQLNAQLPLADAVERARIQANMEFIKDRDICHSLHKIADFISRHGMDLDDHYRNVMCVCRGEN